MRGAFVVFEGPEGGGKTSQARALASGLEGMGYSTVLTREPGGTSLGSAVRDIVLPESSISISPRSEVLLYCASRAQLVEEVIKPALARGEVVVSDRFGYSTIAYQAYGRGLDVASVTEVVRFATGGIDPDMNVLLDLDPGTGLTRKQGLVLSGNPEEWNRYEQEEVAFHERVRNGYLELARGDPERWVVVDAGLPFGVVQDRIIRVVSALLDREQVPRRSR
ncbi:MAG TPA: dTMP kinase [Chloroflexota bacterium]